jgi:hypothetical protein
MERAMNVRPAADHTYFSEAAAPALATTVVQKLILPLAR